MVIKKRSTRGYKRRSAKRLRSQNRKQKKHRATRRKYRKNTRKRIIGGVENGDTPGQALTNPKSIAHPPGTRDDRPAFSNEQVKDLIAGNNVAPLGMPPEPPPYTPDVQ